MFNLIYFLVNYTKTCVIFKLRCQIHSRSIIEMLSLQRKPIISMQEQRKVDLVSSEANEMTETIIADAKTMKKIGSEYWMAEKALIKPTFELETLN